MTGAAFWRLRIHESLPSTQDVCLRLAEAGEPEGLAVMARFQTAGRGSRGRDWQGARGNLALSVLLRPTGPAAEAGQWALLSGLALLEALQAAAPGAALSLKWPNDVLVDGRKLGGVLLDSAAAPGGRLEWLVIGMGANLAAAPSLDGRETAALPTASDPVLVARATLDRIQHWRLVRGLDGFVPMRAAWLRHAHALGSLLRVRTPGATGLDLAGRFAGLGEDGSLLLATGGRVHSLSTGDVLQARE